MPKTKKINKKKDKKEYTERELQDRIALAYEMGKNDKLNEIRRMFGVN